MHKKVNEFMAVSGQLKHRNKFDRELVSLYIGLILEEVAEMLESQGLIEHEEISSLADKWKRQQFAALCSADLLDSFMDIAWVSFGGAWAMGVDVDAAVDELVDSNMSKFEIKHGFRHCVKDANGKVVKPASYRPANFRQFISELL